MPHTRWYWGAVVRVDGVADALRDVARAAGDADGVRVQDPRTGHITLFYAPLRSRSAAPEIAERARGAVGGIAPFDLRLSGFGEFASPTRPVAWLAVAEGGAGLEQLRTALCACDRDCHNHPFTPHLTLAYGEDAAQYALARDAVRATADAVDLRLRVDAVWIAGFPQSGHPARDLRYAERVPLGDA